MKMNSKQTQHKWRTQLGVFARENAGRSTRLGVFEPTGSGIVDYWLEDGLPLREVVCEEINGARFVEIILDGFTHTISNARRLEFLYGTDELDDGLNVIDGDGRTSTLRFDEICP